MVFRALEDSFVDYEILQPLYVRRHCHLGAPKRSDGAGERQHLHVGKMWLSRLPATGTHLLASQPRLKVVGHQTRSAKPRSVPPTIIFHVELPHWFPMAVPLASPSRHSASGRRVPHPPSIRWGLQIKA